MATEFFWMLKQELVVSAILFLLLVLKLGRDRSNTSILNTVNVLLLINFIYGCIGTPEGSIFNGMFETNTRIVLEKSMLNLAVWLLSMQATAWLKDHKHVFEFYLLLLSTLLGMFFMISSANLLMFYLGLELSTIPLAAMVNFDLTRKSSSEGALKMIISSAFSSGLLLLGISFIYGITGTLDYSALPGQLSLTPLTILSFVLLASGFAFKISAVPFHFWTADVYEGAPAPVTAYLSVVSKAAVIFTMVAFLYQVAQPMLKMVTPLLQILALLSITIGNLFALRQQNMKRFLAFSSISQVGFILLAMAGNSREGMAAILYFVLIYIFSNLAAFAVVTLVSAATGRERIDDYKGFYQQNKFLSWVIAIALFSLAGVPPTAGFFGKFFLIFAGAGNAVLWVIVIAALNMVISFYYYLRVVKAIFMEANENPVTNLPVSFWPKLALWISLAGIVLLGLIGHVYDHIFSLSTGPR
jgi:NADH-quinone oxidoreductase subunit N